MTAHPPPSTGTSDREIVATRVFSAPRELVWEAWTNPVHVAQWWGPRGFSTTIERMEVRVGGVWQHVMRGPDGTEYPNKSTFTEVVKPERIAYRHGGGRKGGPGATFEGTWTFTAEPDGRTRVTIRMVFATPGDRDFVAREFGAVEGAAQTLERLGEHLAAPASVRPFRLTRVFNAPRELVWQAWTQEEHLRQWFGPKGVAIAACKMDFRPGGIFHYCMRTPDGHEMWGKWTFAEIVPPEKLVSIVAFSDAAGGITRHPLSATWPLETRSVMTLVENGGKTTLTLEWAPHHAGEAETRTFDSSHESMKHGWAGTMEQFEQYLATLTAQK